MKRLRVHVCLISAQPIPNLTPLLDPEFGPERAILIVTPDMVERAGWLRAVLRDRGVRCDIWDVDDAWDFDHLQSRMLELLVRETEAVDAQDIALNATGGTKLMSIAAYETFRAWSLPIYYVHPREDRMLWLQPAEQSAHDLADRLRIEPFLQAHGAAVSKPPRRNVPEADDLRLAEELIDGVERFAAPLAMLNWLVAQAGPPGWMVKLEKPVGQNGGLEELLEVFAAHGKLRIGVDRITFSGEEDRFFVNGGWIEAWVFDQVRRIRDGDSAIHDVAYGVEVERRRRNRVIPNELDVVFLRNNCLHVIECKTRRFRGPAADSAAAEALYKLDTLRELMGGLQARAMLVSFRDLPDHDRTRAADLRIDVCSGSQLRNLHEHLKRFMQK